MLRVTLSTVPQIRRSLSLLLLGVGLGGGGCRPATPPAATDARHYAEALTAIQADPAQTTAACAPLQGAALRGDCLCAGAEALADAGEVEAAAAICAVIPAGLAHDECWFMVAERTGQPARCGQAGRFTDDCRLHLLQQAVARSPGLDLSEADEIQALIAAAGMAADDPRPWTLLYRHLLAQQRPLDLRHCDNAQNTEARAWCRRAGLGLLHDRLNHVRDARPPGTDAWCAGQGSPPAILDHREDPEITATFAERTDVCAR